MTYKTEVTTAVIQEPKVAEMAPAFTSEIEKEQILIQKRMGQRAQMIQTFTTEQVCKPSGCPTVSDSFLSRLTYSSSSGVPVIRFRAKDHL